MGEISAIKNSLYKFILYTVTSMPYKRFKILISGITLLMNLYDADCDRCSIELQALLILSRFKSGAVVGQMCIKPVRIRIMN
jgi:hypothetical protein